MRRTTKVYAAGNTAAKTRFISALSEH